MSSVSNMSNSLLKFHAHDEQSLIARPPSLRRQISKSAVLTRVENLPRPGSFPRLGLKPTDRVALERKRKKETWVARSKRRGRVCAVECVVENRRPARTQKQSNGN